MYDDTAILFDADHGEPLGDHGIFGKTTFLRGSGDVPLVMRFPDWVPRAHAALEIDTPVLTADLYPTILELAGLAPEEDIDGVSLLPWIEAGRGDRQSAGARIVCGEYGREAGTAFATNGRFKYVYYARGGVEHLFDVVDDPEDLRNLAHHADHSAVMAELRSNLVRTLERFERPLVQDGQLVAVKAGLDEHALRGRNPCAWRGPMRYGQGYGGGW
jgi:arylsulfatase A-like enzyme